MNIELPMTTTQLAAIELLRPLLAEFGLLEAAKYIGDKTLTDRSLYELDAKNGDGDHVLYVGLRVMEGGDVNYMSSRVGQVVEHSFCEVSRPDFLEQIERWLRATVSGIDRVVP